MTGQTKNSGTILTLSKKTKKRFSSYVLCGTNKGRVQHFLSGLVIQNFELKTLLDCSPAYNHNYTGGIKTIAIGQTKCSSLPIGYPRQVGCDHDWSNKEQWYYTYFIQEYQEKVQ